MRNFQPERRWRNIIESRPALVLLGALILFFAWNIILLTEKMQVTRDNRKIVERRIAELEEGKEKFSDEIAKLETKRGVEESIREKFGLAREGEGVIVIVEDKNEPELPLPANTWSFFSFFTNFFK